MATITDNDLALFRERAKTELMSTCDVGRMAWDRVVEALCDEVARLRSVSKERSDYLCKALVAIKALTEPHAHEHSELGTVYRTAKAFLAEESEAAND